MRSLREILSKYTPIVLAIAIAAGLLRASPASAANCLKDEFGKNVQCTANDVRIASATGVRNLDGSSLTSCIAGSTFSFVADFHVVTTATARENIGLYFATGGQTSALTGSCSDNIIAPTHSINAECTAAGAPFSFCTGSGTGTSTAVLGSALYHENDASPDNCGDTLSADGTNQIVTVEVDNAKCQAAPGTNKVGLPNCTSWQQPGGTNLCVSAPPTFPYPQAPAAVPGSPSKCNCDSTFTIPVTVQSPTISVTKNCSTANGAGTLPTPSCTLTPEGGTVTYTVDISNTSNFGSVVVDQICDSAYGSIFTASGFTPACPAGSVGGTISNNTCSALTIAQGTDKSCTFQVSQAENKVVTDFVSVTGHGSSAGTFGPTNSNSATVTSGEAASTATITKSLVSTTAGCATVRYGVDVKNTSSADEDLTLSALSDDGYGDITTVQGSVLGTTCGVATGSPGSGTLKDSTGGGSLSTTLPVGGSDYICQFDAQFCGTLTTITISGSGTCTNGTCSTGKTGTSCSTNSDCNLTCNGIEHVNKVTGTLTGDDDETVTLTPGTLTVDECFTTFSH
jgi:hypothetical protein